MIKNNPYQAYHKTRVETASPGALMLMLFDGAIKFLRTAMQGLSTNDFAVSNDGIIKAQAIINELMTTLDTENGGELAQNLYRIYDYLYWRLINANMEKNPEILDEVLEKLIDLRQTWKEVIKINRNNGSQTAKGDGKEALKPKQKEG